MLPNNILNHSFLFELYVAEFNIIYIAIKKNVFVTN